MAIKYNVEKLIYNFKNIKMQIGLLGGSFDPPHDGHLHISSYAQKDLQLDEVWWIVAKQNPHKANHHLSFDERVNSCLNLCEGNEKIKILTIEQDLNQSNSFDIVNYLKANLVNCHFTWIMGADLIDSLPNWHKSREFVDLVNIAIFTRPGYNAADEKGKLAKNFSNAKNIKIFDIPALDISSSKIRNKLI